MVLFQCVASDCLLGSTPGSTLGDAQKFKSNNGCGRWIYGVCAGLSRSALNGPMFNGRFLRYLCEYCVESYDYVKASREVSASIKAQNDTIGDAMTRVARLQSRMNVHDEHFDQLEKSISFPISCNCVKHIDGLERRLTSLINSLQ